MAGVWITEINNYSQYEFVVRSNDPSWRPIINGYRYAVDEPILVRPRRDQIETTVLPPWNIPISVPPGPTLIKCEYFFVSWTDFGRTRIEGPDGLLDVMVGPTGAATAEERLDHLRIFDAQQNVVGDIPMGPGGSQFVASVDLHLNFDDEQVRWLIWKATSIGSELLDRADKIATGLGTEILKKLVLPRIPTP